MHAHKTNYQSVVIQNSQFTSYSILYYQQIEHIENMYYETILNMNKLRILTPHISIQNHKKPIVRMTTHSNSVSLI